ncbi:MAG: phenylalanine--tRNA ligase subunit beta [Deltaproteobacteria bacterium]|nr:MAG: phenylalanine--tRNA ligase subunit beta [Deltaproteobacteria bacterium]
MKFTLNWLKEYIDLDMPVEALADKLTMLGLEVDNVAELYQELEPLKVARITDVRPHPDADRLSLCDVTLGEETFQVVCGAPNAKPDMLTAIALPGITLPGGMQVKKAAIRGQESSGMLCSERDLGISEDHSGIMELPDSARAGQLLIEALSLRDTLIEVDLTPNRPDCTSVIGIAREVAGFTDQKMDLPVKNDLPELTGEGVPFSVEVLDPEDCPRYAARLLKNVTIGPSPWWLKKRLLSIGLRPINNVVDITNLVMLEYGQPLHAFDFDRLAGGKIIVRRARAGEDIVTLDGEKRELDQEMLLICDADKPVAVAGVMGGENSEVIDSTKDILLESACFNPLSVRRTARHLNLGTEASYRFERGVDPELAPRAMERAVQLLVELAGAEAVDNGYDCVEGITGRETITLRVSRTNDLLGMELDSKEIARCLESIELQVDQENDNTLLVTPPSFRVDLDREVDLIEEVARLQGYNEIPTAMPIVPMSFPEQQPGLEIRKKLSAMLVSQGFFEAVNYSFVDENYFDQLNLEENDPVRRAVALLNPLSEDQGIMRTLMLPSLLQNISRNTNRQNNDIKMFEIGKVFHPVEGEPLPDENMRVAGVISGRRYPGASLLHFGNPAVDIYDCKGTVEAILQEVRIAKAVNLEVSNESNAAPIYIQPDSYIVYRAGDKLLGYMGKIDTDVLKSFGIKQDVFFFDLDLDLITELKPEPKSFKQLPKFPSVKWDIALIVPDSVASGDLLTAIDDAGEALVESAEIFDVYRGDAIEAGNKSVAISLIYRSVEQTLDDKTVDKVHQRLIKMLEERFQGKLREAV